MPRDVLRDEVRMLVERGAQLVEVLSAKAYESGHLPGAVNLPLAKLGRKSAAALHRDRPVIVYCWDYQ